MNYEVKFSYVACELFLRKIPSIEKKAMGFIKVSRDSVLILTALCLNMHHIQNFKKVLQI